MITNKLYNLSQNIINIVVYTFTQKQQMRKIIKYPSKVIVGVRSTTILLSPSSF